MSKNKMKAAVHQKYGPPSVVKIKEIERPVPMENEVLIKVYSSTVNRTDCGFRSAEYFISRFFSGLFRPKQQTLGSEFAGEIVETGAEVSLFKVGEKVFGFNDSRFGGHAQYLCVKESDAIATLPIGYDVKHTAALSEGAHYALTSIKAAKLQPGQDVLVYGATGAIGSAAVQLLKYFNVHITAVCNTKNVALIQSFGVDKVIDYQTEDFTKFPQNYDFIFDAVGKSSFKVCKKLLKSKGIYISTELGKNGVNIPLALITPLFRGRRLIFPIPIIKKETIEFIKELVENGTFKPVIDRYYSLDQIVEAYEYVETGQKTGNVVLSIHHDD